MGSDGRGRQRTANGEIILLGEKIITDRSVGSTSSGGYANQGFISIRSGRSIFDATDAADF
jgi:hypothetical protein